MERALLTLALYGGLALLDGLFAMAAGFVVLATSWYLPVPEVGYWPCVGIAVTGMIISGNLMTSQRATKALPQNTD